MIHELPDWWFSHSSVLETQGPTLATGAKGLPRNDWYVSSDLGDLIPEQ